MSSSSRSVPAAAAAPSAVEASAQTWPAISVITPTLNCGRYVEQAIQSVLDQDYPNVEHLIVDGGSTDGTLETVRRHPHLRVVSRPDRHSHEAMNRGVGLAKGEIIGFLNGDDLYDRTVLAEVARVFGDDPALDIVCGGFLVFEGDQGERRTVLRRTRRRGACLDWTDLTLGGPGFNAFFFRKRLFDRLGPFDLEFRISADRDFLIRAAMAGTRSAAIGRPTYRYRRHDASQTLDAARRNAGEIGREHLRMAEQYLAGGGLDPTVRRHIRVWRAFEILKLALRDCRRRHFREAGTGIARAWRVDGRWPWSVLIAVLAKRRLGREVFEPPAPGSRSPR